MRVYGSLGSHSAPDPPSHGTSVNCRVGTSITGPQDNMVRVRWVGVWAWCAALVWFGGGLFEGGWWCGLRDGLGVDVGCMWGNSQCS